MTTTSNAKTWIVAEYRSDDFYGQTENLTLQAAHALAEKIRESGHEASVVDNLADLESF